MNLVVYLNPSAGTDPGHMVVGRDDPPEPTALFGFRFNPLGLPEEFRPPNQWRSFLFSHTVPGDIVDESDYVAEMRKVDAAGYYTRSTPCADSIIGLLPPEREWRSFANYSFNPDDFDAPTRRCFNCVTWAVEVADRMVEGFLQPVRQGRVKEMVKQLEPLR